MPTPLETLVAAGSKLWLDSVDPDFIQQFQPVGATGATSNPIIISDLVRSGRFDRDLKKLMEQGRNDEQVAWQMTDRLVRQAQDAFQDVYSRTAGDDGYVSFELDPLLEDTTSYALSLDERIAQYIKLGRAWSEGHSNRMIKVPATPAGLAALDELVASGVTVNVTLLFTSRQYRVARDAIWRGAQRRPDLDRFKSVYSIFISRMDVYTRKQVLELSTVAQGKVGIVSAKRIWQENQEFWIEKQLPLKQEIVFASTGSKAPSDPADKYVAALAGSDIQTNPPATNAAIQKMSGKVYARTVDQMPSQNILDEIDNTVDFSKLEDVLMPEGLKKFADPQKALLELIAQKRSTLAGGE